MGALVATTGAAALHEVDPVTEDADGNAEQADRPGLRPEVATPHHHRGHHPGGCAYGEESAWVGERARDLRQCHDLDDKPNFLPRNRRVPYCLLL